MSPLSPSCAVAVGFQKIVKRTCAYERAASVADICLVQDKRCCFGGFLMVRIVNSVFIQGQTRGNQLQLIWL